MKEPLYERVQLRAQSQWMGQWITNPSRTIRSQIVFYQNPKDSKFKNGEKIGNTQTDQHG
jgi:hypothetical protein